MQVKVITPEKELFNGEAKSINLPTEAGWITILPFHTELISAVVPGKITIDYEDGEKEFMSVGGVVEVYKNEVNILLKKF